MAYYAGMLPQDKLSMKEIRLLALLEDLDIALGTHPADQEGLGWRIQRSRGIRATR